MRALRKKVREEYDYQYGVGNYDTKVRQDYHNIIVGGVVIDASKYSIDQIKKVCDEFGNS